MVRIDRASFLALTFGMAGASCNGGPAATAPATVVEIPRQPQQAADGGATDLAAAPVAPPPKTDVDDDDDGVAMPQPTEEGGNGGGPFSGSRVASTGCGWVDPKSVKTPAVACQEDQGIAGTCNVMKSCKGFPFPREKCEAYRTFMKPQVAQRALACLSKLSDKQVCDACTAYRCGDQALKTSCPDSTVDTMCMSMIRQCTSVSMSDCRTYLWGLNAAGRSKMMKCVTSKSGCGFGIYSCSEGVL
jgi:hypothetical protein